MDLLTLMCVWISYVLYDSHIHARTALGLLLALIMDRQSPEGSDTLTEEPGRQVSHQGDIILNILRI